MIDFEQITYEEARDLKLHLEGLLDHPGWKFLCEVVEARASTREKELLEMCPTNMEQLSLFNRVKGGIDELRFVPLLMNQLLSDVSEEVRRIQDEIEAEEDQQ